MLEPKIITKPALTVVGLEASFIHALSPDATNFEVIGPLWNQFLHQVNQVTHRTGEEMFGVIYGRPESERSHPDELQYIAAVPVNSMADIPDGMVSHTILENVFAVFTHTGPINKIGDTAREIYREWLPQSGYQHSEVADVELYDHRFHCDSADSEMEYWISVKPEKS